jgi:pyrroline-5-carboxylate reductase
MESKRIAVVGTGNMGEAILRGVLEADWADPKSLRASHPRQERREELTEELGITLVEDNAEAARWADIVVVAVKPQIIEGVLDGIADAVTPDDLVVSIAAGVETSTAEAHLPDGVPVVRAMPNVTVTVDVGATAVCAGTHATEKGLAAAKAIFEAVGVAVEVDEYLMDAVTGLSGTGPMYIFQIIEGLSDAGVKVGLSRHDANTLAVHTVLGAAEMAVETDKHPGELKDMVTSPGGTAISALHSMEQNGLRALLIDAVEAATERSKELGEMAEDGDG